MSEWMNRVFLGSSERMEAIPDGVVHTCVTSPPYFGLRKYGSVGEIGGEPTLTEYIDRLVAAFREVRRVLRDDGTAWLNLGDSYATRGTRMGNRHGNLDETSRDDIHRGGYRSRPAGFKEKDLMLVPHRVAIALQDDGWWIRDAIPWVKPNPMPSSVTDRCTSSYEMVFMLAKSARYFANMDAVREPLAEATLNRINQAKWRSGEQAGSERANGGAKTNGPMKAVVRGRGTIADSTGRQIHQEGRDHTLIARSDDPDAYNLAGANLRNVWTIATTPYFGDHPAVMPRELATRCILIGSPGGGIVLDPFMGSGTVAECALGNGRSFTGYEINEAYHREIEARLGLFGAGGAA